MICALYHLTLWRYINFILILSYLIGVICCRSMHGVGITIFSSKATLTAYPLVLASKFFSSLNITLKFHRLVVYLISFLPRDATQSAVMRLHVVCPFVCPSVTFRSCDHIGWNSSKIMSRPNSLRLMRSQHGWSGATGTPQNCVYLLTCYLLCETNDGCS